MSSGQVRIVSFNPVGVLEWTNSLGPGLFDPIPDTEPVYRLDRGTSAIGPWSELTNTTQLSVSLTNWPPNGSPQVYYRLSWTNGQVWNYSGYEGPNLVVTGKLYFNVSFDQIDGGSWILTRTGFPDSGRHRAGAGSLDSCSDCSGRVYLAPYCCDDGFWLEGPNPVSMTWTGDWHWAGFVGDATGSFVAQRIPNGQ